MNVQKFLNDLDRLYEEKRLIEVEPFFAENFHQAVEEKDQAAQFTILNEMMGFFRDTSQYDKSIQTCNQCIQLMKDMGIEGTVDYATSLQNIANAYRAAGMLDKAIELYNESYAIYKENISMNDYRIASLNNNIALVYQEMGDFKQAAEHLHKALSIVEQLKDAEITIAITCSNLAASLLEIGDTKKAVGYLERALDIFSRDEIKDFHYSAALSAMATAKCKMGQYEQAVPLYEEALKEIEINMGKGTAYQTTAENLKKVKEKLEKGTTSEKNIEDSKCFGEKISGIELARAFYKEYGAPMIHERFPDYEDRIAVGFVGEGSERFGFDDVLSRDHDFGPGFCMWVTKDVYEEIGEELQAAYDALPITYKGITRIPTKMAQGRVGVSMIGDFYEKYTGYRQSPDTIGKWIDIEDYKLATVTNGEVFRDDEGIFTDIREQFANQPEASRLVKLARVISAMAQTGQSNYGRSMARKDYVTAQICISEFMQNTMRCVYILNRAYAPYYKWMLKGIKELKILPEMEAVMRALADMQDQRKAWDSYTYDNMDVNGEDQKALTVEIVAKLVINELKNQGIVDNVNSNFLNDYVDVIMKKAGESIAENEMTNMKEEKREQVIDEIVKLEFEAFDKVQNVDGRAACQDDWVYFEIMRKSQYMTWTDEMLVCIRNLWLENKAKGWNMITEKYGRMMEHTAPQEYEQIKDSFPVKSDKTKAIVNQIAQIQVQWMEAFAQKYPKLASNARDITSDKDSIDNTSYETYLKGELLTYSERLLKMYAQFIIDLYNQGKNLAYMTIENTVHLQGYQSLEQAEEFLM